MNAALWLTSPVGAVLGVMLTAALAWGPLRWPELPADRCWVPAPT